MLSVNERRVLGVLVEKQKTTDTYPLTPNTLLNGCNQKNNRDPLLNLADHAVEEALAELKNKGLVMQVVSGRVDKWRHLLYEVWQVNSVELAVLAELLLRGPQTEGELRGRASRMDQIADLDTLRGILKTLAERKLVVYLTPEGRRGTTLTHGFHDPLELEHIRAHGASSVQHEEKELAATSAPASELIHARLTAIEGQISNLQSAIDELRAQIARLSPGGP
jgi:uncharacterized protein YceH (UPF0502 family)